MAEQRIGKVTHYFSRVQVAIVQLSGPLRVGDRIRIRGHTTEVQETVESMQINHVPVQEAKAGDEVAIKVMARAREGDDVAREIPEPL